MRLPSCIAVITLMIAECAYGASSVPTGKLSEQIGYLPAEFEQYFFDTPLTTRVMLNGKILGDAVIVLTKQDTVQLLEFSDSYESPLSNEERERWARNLSQPIALGDCSTACPDGLLAVDYNLANAQLMLVTKAAGNEKTSRYYQLPENGSTGLLLNNQFYLSAGEKQDTAGSWYGQMQSSIGNWTLVSGAQYDRSDNDYYRSNHRISSLYAQREYDKNYLRLGLFTPDSQDILREAYISGRRTQTAVGVMLGSSDSLLQQSASASLYPVYVTANRESTVEIYRNGALINSQPVEPGLQLIDTTTLPAGIYDVDVRVIEDGNVISQSTETIHKPTQWRDLDRRWLYTAWLGQQESLWDNDDYYDEGDAIGGASVNYLLHPRLIGGVAGQKIGSENQAGVALDWQPIESLRLYSNVFHSNRVRDGFAARGSWNYFSTSVSVGHGRTWYQGSRHADEAYYRQSGVEENTDISVNYRLNNRDSIFTRVAHNSNDSGSGVGYDFGYNSRQRIAGVEVNWRLSLFDRPYSYINSTRNRGFILTTYFSLGENARRANVSVGSRNSNDGQRDFYTSASLTQSWDNDYIRETTGTVTLDRYGVGFGLNNMIASDIASGSTWLQSSTKQSTLSGGLNLNNTVVVGGGTATISPEAGFGSGAGLIVDVESDDPRTKLMAYHSLGRTELSPGRNLIPVDAWKPGSVEFEFMQSGSPAYTILPSKDFYHLNRGGVSYHKLRVMKTLTVIGRLIDKNGTPLSGARLTNNAGRSVTESDGFFTLELHETTPVITAEHQSGVKCEIPLSLSDYRHENDTLFVGELVCANNQEDN